MVLKSYAKINLFLSVNKKIKNKLHDLQTIFCLVNYYDKISVKKIKSKKKDKISFKGPYSRYINQSNNSIKLTLNLLRKYKLISDFYAIDITKKIPVFAGLGGGTSNSVTIFKSLVKKKINNSLFIKIVKKIGSDFPIFFFKQGYLKNLRKISKLPKKYDLYFLIVYPNIKCSTKEIYFKNRNFSKKRIFSDNKLKSKREFIKLLAILHNDLQLVVEKKYPIIQDLLADIKDMKGCHFSRMTGSGSTCFGLFSNKYSSKVALKKIRKKYPKFSILIAKTI